MDTRLSESGLPPFIVDAESDEHYEDSAWPYFINQLTGQQVGNFSDPWNDCGPACLAACYKRTTGQLIAPDAIRDTMYWDGYRGYTTTNKLSNYVKEQWEWYSEQGQYTDEDALHIIRTLLIRGFFVITLTLEPAGYYHFTCITGYGPDHIVRHNPLGGFREVLTIEQFTDRFAGWLLILDDK